ncbi:VOC family protein [Pseudonocardia kujensis]|uniref:VOC family protein n=1 Tax=Pseudonocardia kujensis TaxID=1128675 RepID=UPI001E34AF5B|nr:VOC family protein [Pseudonocardia kujensis]MCE0767444.1 VOC family protein [Pseudonocardia kujensis]
MTDTHMAIGVPTATNVDHVAWTVPDLDAAVAFLRDVLGGTELFRAGPFGDPTGDWVSDHFDVPARATGVLAMVRLGPTQVVELLEWTCPDQRTTWPRNHDRGATHLALQVGDIDAAREYLVAHGCTPCGDPVLLEDVPHAGLTILYLRTPIDLYLELVHRPGGALPYEASTDGRLLRPAAAWTNS